MTTTSRSDANNNNNNTTNNHKPTTTRSRGKKSLSLLSLSFLVLGIVLVVAYPWSVPHRRQGAVATATTRVAKQSSSSVATTTSSSSSSAPGKRRRKRKKRKKRKKKNKKTDTTSITSKGKTKMKKAKRKKRKKKTKQTSAINPPSTTTRQSNHLKTTTTTTTTTTTNHLPTPPPLPFVPRKTKYIASRHDRAGSVIGDLLKAHAYLFQRGDAFGGSCGTTKWQSSVEQLVETVGLSSLLRYACPDGATEPADAPPKYMVSRSKYRHDEEHTFTPEWIQYMKQAMQMQNSSRNSSNATSSSSKEDEHQVLEVAVHIRRGDVSLCTDNAKRRYLPNSHYLRLIDRVIAQQQQQQSPNRTTPVHVTIYSESSVNYSTRKGTQYETLQPFVDRNYTINLDGNVQQVWRAFMDADILIMSMSGFSLTPALLRLDRPGVIFTPHQNAYMLPHWTLVPQADMQRMAAEMKQMQMTKCPQHGKEVDFFDDPLHDYERHYYTHEH